MVGDINRSDDFSENINVGQNSGISIKDLANIIITNVGFVGEVVYDTTKQDGAPEKRMGDEKFRKRFPLFKFTDFYDGVMNTIKYYESIYPY